VFSGLGLAPLALIFLAAAGVVWSPGGYPGHRLVHGSPAVRRRHRRA